jgi:AcrR family transcriptional regulator
VNLLDPPEPPADRRVRRSRAALLAAAVRLVTERETTTLAVSDLAEAADVSRRVDYQHFEDKDALLLEAALDLARRAAVERRERIPGTGPEAARANVVDIGRHMAEHRPFYRTMLTGSCAYAFNRALCEVFAPANRQIVHHRYGDQLAPATADDLTDFLTAGVATIIHTWVIEAEEPLDPEDLADRLATLLPLVTGPTPPDGAPELRSTRSP